MKIPLSRQCQRLCKISSNRLRRGRNHQNNSRKIAVSFRTLGTTASPSTRTNNSNSNSNNNNRPRYLIKKGPYNNNGNSSNSNSKRQSSYNKRQSPASLLIDQWETNNSNNNKSNNNNNLTISIQRKRFEERQRAFCDAVVEYRNIWFGTPSESNVATNWKEAMQFQHPMKFADIEKKRKMMMMNNNNNNNKKEEDYHQLLVESERTFGEICSLCHELFVATALLAESEQETNYPKHNSNNNNNDSAGEFLVAVLPFWEAMRKDRSSLVELYYSNEENPLLLQEKEEERRNDIDSSSSTTTTEKKGNWIQWIQSMVGGKSSDESSTSAVSTSTTTTSSKEYGKDIIEPIQVTAHQDPQYAPNHYHYNKLVGRLYFSFPPLISLQQHLPTTESSPSSLDDSNTKFYQDRMEILELRAAHIQRIINQVPQYTNDYNNADGTNSDRRRGRPNSSAVRSPVLTDKTVRLLIRSYQDIGTLDAAYKTEQIYHRYPEHRKGLLWYVLMSYLQVTQRDGTNSSSSSSSSPLQYLNKQPKKKYSPKSASLATKRVCELLSKHVQYNMNQNEFHSCATIGFQCLANIAVDSIDQYYDRVHALAVLKFGPTTWDALLSGNIATAASPTNIDNLDLRPKDSASLQLLVQIYGKWNVKKAQSLLETIWKIYSINELKESIERATFHSLLLGLNKRQKGPPPPSSSSNHYRHQHTINSNNGQDFDYALSLLDKMMSHEVWYPNEATFNHLFRLVKTGPQADRLFKKLELSRAVTQDYAISPLKASKHALRGWLQTAMSGMDKDGIAMERALEIFQRLLISSRPLLFQASPELVSHVYNPQDSPTKIIYSLVWETCYQCGTNSTDDDKKQRAAEIAILVYQAAKDQDMKHPLQAKAYNKFLKCLSLSEDEDQQLELAREIFEATSKSPEEDRSVDPTLLEALLDCLVSTNGDNRRQERLELIQDIYDVVLNKNEIPVLTEQFLTHLGRLHPKLYEQHIAEHPHEVK